MEVVSLHREIAAEDGETFRVCYALRREACGRGQRAAQHRRPHGEQRKAIRQGKDSFHGGGAQQALRCGGGNGEDHKSALRQKRMDLLGGGQALLQLRGGSKRRQPDGVTLLPQGVGQPGHAGVPAQYGDMISVQSGSPLLSVCK